PGKSMSEGDDESASASESESDTTTTTGDASATDTDADTDTTTGALELDFPCDGARWLTVHRPGEFVDLAVDSRGHVLGFGILGHEGDPNDALITDFNASGALVRNVLYASNSDDGVRAGGVDGSDQVYALVLEKGEPWLRKHDTDGVVAWALPLLEAMNAGFEPTER